MNGVVAVIEGALIAAELDTVVCHAVRATWRVGMNENVLRPAQTVRHSAIHVGAGRRIGVQHN